MIVRPVPTELLAVAEQHFAGRPCVAAITQVDHAQLSGQLFEQWVGPCPARPAGGWSDGHVVDEATLHAAIAHHDDGWRERDEQPLTIAVTPTDARPQPDPAPLRLMNFAETPLTIDADIWRDSVRRVHGGRMQPPEWFAKTIDRRTYEYLWCLLSNEPRDWSLDEVATRYHEQVGIPVDPDALAAVATAMLQHGSAVGEPARLRLQPFAAPRAELAGAWVARHFAALASMARDKHANDAAVVRAADLVLADARRQVEEATAACRPWGTEADVSRWLDDGFHAVQFFDLWSLTLCRLVAGQTPTIERPGWGRYSLQATSDHAATVDPWPFAASRLEVEVPCRVLPGELPSATDWRLAIRSAPRLGYRVLLTSPE